MTLFKRVSATFGDVCFSVGCFCGQNTSFLLSRQE